MAGINVNEVVARVESKAGETDGPRGQLEQLGVMVDH
jgi:hypothetical protein